MSSYRPYYDAATFRSPSANLNDLDYLDGMDRPWIHAVGYSAVQFYAKQLASQPFEVSQYLLQVHNFCGVKKRHHAVHDSDSDDEPDYFTNTDGSRIKTLQSKPTKVREISNNMQLVPATPPVPGPMLDMKEPSLFGTISAVMDRDGTVGLWRGINTSCLYVAATGIIEAWISGFLSSLLGIPDAQFGDIMQSNDPQAFLAIGALSTGISHLILSPVLLIRSRMIVTPMKGYVPRSLRSALLHLPSCPPSVWIPDICSSVWSKLIEISTPWILFQKLSIDEFRSPTYYGLLSLGVEVLSLLVKLPLDTFTRRAQVSALGYEPEELVIEPVLYKGFLPSVIDVLLFRVPLSSLYRGWRYELVRTLSKWGYIALEVNQPIKEKF